MRKIPTLFVRDFTQPRAPITHEYHPDALWVSAGEGVATRKYDGTACLVPAYACGLYKRYTLKEHGVPPAGFIPVETDAETLRTVGWVPISYTGKEDRWYREALAEYPLSTLVPGCTYELIGPKVNGNPEKTDLHELIAHDAAEQYTDVPTGFRELREWLTGRDIEGIVWHHLDGQRMAKIKLADFGLKRGVA